VAPSRSRSTSVSEATIDSIYTRSARLSSSRARLMARPGRCRSVMQRCKLHKR
jgi:hypothetical protein